MRSGKVRILCLCAVVILLLCTPPFATLRSMGVMSLYSAWCARDSIEKEKGFRLEIPGGMLTGERDWYPMTLFYDASEEYAWRSGTDRRLNIYYNFPCYDLWKGCSELYNPDSPYYMGFYGAYLLEGSALELEEIVGVLRFDLFELVLDDFGLEREDEVFSYTIESATPVESYAGQEEWFRWDARVLVNGAAHSKQGFRRSYLQYGIPKEETEKAFEPVELYGRMIGRYFERWDTSVFFYILAADPEVLEECDRRILSQSRLICNNKD